MTTRLGTKLFVCIMMVTLLLVFPLVGRGQEETTEEGAENWLDITVALEITDTADFLDNPNDVVTPYVEDKFKIRVQDVIQGGLMTIGFKERLATYIASNNLPDVIVAGSENCAYAVSTGYYGEGYANLIENNMPNMNRYFDQRFWPRYMNDGVKTQIPQVQVNTSEEPYKSDPYVTPLSAWALWVREDLLEQCGYSFTPLSEIAAATTDQGILPTLEDFEITPAIDTPEKLRELLEKIDALNITTGDAKMVPFSSSYWSQFHLGSMFDFGHWRIRDDGDVGGFLGTDGAKEYYKYLNGLYQDGLIDPDFIVQTSDQLQQKISAGRVGAGMYIPNLISAQNALYQTVGDDAVIRYIPWPKEGGSDLGAFDIYEAGFFRIIIRSDFPEKERLIEYFDWFFSDEGMELCSWGPESAGLWALDENGEKYIVDEEARNDIINGISGGKGADYYGLYNSNEQYYPFQSKAAACAPFILNYNPFDPVRSVKPNLSIQIVNRSRVSMDGLDMSGRYAYGDGSNEVAGISSWYWSKFTGEAVAPLLTAKNEAEFDESWDDMYRDFVDDTEYELAVEHMRQWFAENSEY